MEQRLTEAWYRERARPSLLTPLAGLYGAMMCARRRAYVSGWVRTERAGKPVVVIGNLTVGGTGKTPLTIWLARQLLAQGLKVGIVSRGYGRRGAAARAVHSTSDWRQVGDEPLIIARRTACPTVVARDRVAGARALVAAGVDVVLADDGLQHLRLGRDCEIVVIDGARGFGNGRVLPAGPLREPLERLPQPDAVVMNGAPEHGSLTAALRSSPALEMRLVAQEALRLDGLEPPRALQGFSGQRLHAIAGIGNPARFFGELRAHGIEVIEHAFADHHRFVPAELAFADGLPVLMTEKDAVKCLAFADPRLWYVPVAAQFGAREAHELLARVLAKVRPASVAGGQI
ncbi:MAG TPA: tetraacyldisaccharide 4'-kinase [Steroidobacteraceae bacterium]|nr:tetraacyldisaccharide 4'-kinase [Steroidobacteraceae bacterium]